MSLQAEHCIQVLISLYVELDQRTGWVDRAKLIAFFQERGIAEGRTTHALHSLRALKMIDEQGEGPRIKLSGYGVDWLERTLPLASRGEFYHFSMPFFRRVKLVGPDEFYGRKRAPKDDAQGSLDWTKWGVIVAVLIGAITIAIMKGWL